jgi:hypothetical protein
VTKIPLRRLPRYNLRLEPYGHSTFWLIPAVKANEIETTDVMQLLIAAYKVNDIELHQHSTLHALN